MNLTMLLDMAVDGFGDRVLVGRRNDGLTAIELWDRSRAGAHHLRDKGVDSLVYLAANGPAYPVAMFSAALAGVPLVPVNYRLGESQLRQVLDQHAGALILADPQLRTLPDRLGIQVITSEDWLKATAAPADDDLTPSSGDGPAIIIYTSGTTSAPKGVLLKHENLVSYVLQTVEFASAGAEEAALVSVPPYHIAAVANVLSNLVAGRRAVVLTQFSGPDWLQMVRQEAITHALVVPTMLTRILQVPGDRSVPTLRNLAYGGAPMPRSLIERVLELWPHVGFVNAYGLTETSSTIAVLGPGDHRAAIASEDPAVRARVTSVGRPLDSIDLQIRGAGGEALGPGQVGRIFVRGAQVSAEYAGIGRLVDAEGYFDTRDEGWLDDDGFLFICGRADDTIIRGGENIAPAEIEDVLYRHPAVDDVAVIGVPDEEWGERIEAVVVPAGGVTIDPEEIREFAHRWLRTSKTPDQVHLVDSLPRTETGKLLRRQVLESIRETSATVDRAPRT